MDGRSLLGSWAGPTSVSVGKSDGTIVHAARSQIRRGMAETIRRKRIFGPTWNSLLATGLPPRLVGRNTRSLRSVGVEGARLDLDNEESFVDVELSSLLVPARITGSIEGVRVSDTADLVVAVNSRIVASTRSFRIRGKQRFSALVPETAFRNGFNRVELFELEHAGSMRLRRLGGNGAEEP